MLMRRARCLGMVRVSPLGLPLRVPHISSTRRAGLRVVATLALSVAILPTLGHHRAAGAAELEAIPQPTAPTATIASIPANALNVRSLGAKGDGVTNDRPVLQAAVDAAPRGATLYVPAGTDRLDAPIQVRRGYLTLVGDGPASVIHHGGVGAFVLGTARWEEGLVVTRLKFLGLPGRYLADGNTAKAIFLNGTLRAVIQDCDFEGPGMAVFNNGGATYGTQILDCRVKGWGEVGFFCNDWEQVRNCTLIQDDPSVTEQRSSHGMYIHSGARSVMVTDCLIENVRKFAIQLYGQSTDTTLDGVQLLRNTIRNCRAGVIVTSPSEGPMFRNITLNDNRFEDVEETAIRIMKGDQVSVRNNTITRCADGVVLADWNPTMSGFFLKGVNVENNKISHCNGAIWVIAQNGEPLQQIVIDGNTITDCGSTLVIRGARTFSSTIR
jgi:hypothetical protein